MGGQLILIRKLVNGTESCAKRKKTYHKNARILDYGCATEACESPAREKRNYVQIYLEKI